MVKDNQIRFVLDYPLPSLAIGLAGYFKEKPLVGTGVAFFTKFICHFISGLVFFGAYAADYGMNPWIYSFVVNAPMVASDAVICIVILAVIPLKKLISNKSYSNI